MTEATSESSQPGLITLGVKPVGRSRVAAGSGDGAGGAEQFRGPPQGSDLGTRILAHVLA